MNVGDWWKYQVFYDVNIDNPDTLTLRIASMTSNGTSSDYTCYMYNNAGVAMDSGHFVQTSTSLTYQGRASYSIFGFFTLQFPFAPLGGAWPGSFPTDTIRSEGLSSAPYTTGGVTYSTVYSITQRFFDPLYSDINVIFIAPKVGILYQSVDIQSDTASYIQDGWQLIDYYVH